MTGERFLELTQIDIEEKLIDLLLAVSQQMYFQQDWAPSHNGTRVMNHLINHFNGPVIAINAPVRWLTRSPDLSTLDLFVLGYTTE